MSLSKTRSSSLERPNSALFLPVTAGGATAKRLRATLDGLPPLAGRPISIEFHRAMRVHRRRLRFVGEEGFEVNAASAIRRRRILLGRCLTRHPAEFTRMLIHEVFHFAWVRLSNARRRSFEELIAAEFARHARGELGWSAETRKRGLSPADSSTRDRRWREYLSESFCDTAAWFYAGVAPHEEFTLAERWRAPRTRWFRNFCPPGGQVAI